MKKENILITPDVIEECLSESLDTIEKKACSYSKKQKSLK
ncbi:hypothetical protein WX45_03401 [Clostridium ljungdahlii DSM 13528]|uniref:Uncharacterized protein n=3 Tax=Clostridium TaxID=1485 RepID=A0A166TT97_9CLOT|nr:Hypothetical protein CLAU_3874 [Clostridium autoethanogenum DSM 10061]OAA87917.1 hypothetical protein WX45_03401 [Clostridium ljungdahlii DSM 13528]OAA94060.1 hypothetical protein WX73_03630 [Clostridium coskatii]OBR97091.1 hypothetical protein CLRAG_00100 [Clostridium ragsdalei P11]OVY51064.1 hypothetical protein WX72_02226 [Clostridium autoethanogenum]